MKKIPQRSCVVCRTKKDKNELIRIVKNKNNEINIDYLFGDTPKGNSKLGKEIIFDLQNILESLSRYE